MASITASLSKYMRPVKWLGGAVLLIFAFGLLWNPISTVLFSAESRTSVLINSIPFVAFFICILLLFILLIFIVAIRFNGKIPGRSYNGIEFTLIAGIGVSIVCLFQPWTLVPYRYGFILLLASTLGFILWSHVKPGSALMNASLPPLTVRQQIIGALAGLVVVVVLTTAAASTNAPQEPYGVRQRIWNTYTDEKKAAIVEEANFSFQRVEIPFLLVFNLFPASIVFFLLRELVGGKKQSEEQAASEAAASSAGHP